MMQEQDMDQNVFKMNKTLFEIKIAILSLFCLIPLIATGFSFITIVFLCLILVIVLDFIYTSITIGKNGVEYRRGWLSTTFKQIPYDKINSVDAKISLMGNLLDYGKIWIFTGNDADGIGFKSIDKPNVLRQLIENELEKDKHKRGSIILSDDKHKISSADELEKLAKLRDKGIITEEEFVAKKRQILDL